MITLAFPWVTMRAEGWTTPPVEGCQAWLEYKGRSFGYHHPPKSIQGKGFLARRGLRSREIPVGARLQAGGAPLHPGKVTVGRSGCSGLERGTGHRSLKSCTVLRCWAGNEGSIFLHNAGRKWLPGRFPSRKSRGSQGRIYSAAPSLCRDVLLELPRPPALPGDAHTRVEHSRSQKAAETSLCTARSLQSLISAEFLRDKPRQRQSSLQGWL